MPGDRYERVFVRMFVQTQETNGADWWAQRAAASGSATEADLPDVTFAHDGLGFAGELKTTIQPYIYVDEDEVEALQDYADAYGMEAVVLGRFKRERAYYVWNPEDMDRTDARKYRGRADDDNWAMKIAEPDGAAEGILPSEVTSFHLHHSLSSELSGQVTEPPAADGGEADA